MSHSSDNANAATHDGPSYDDVNTPVIVLIGAISAIVTLLVVLFVQGLCYHLQNRYLTQRSSEVEAMPSRVIVDSQKKVLEGGEGVTSIDDAIKKVVSTYGK